MFFLLAEQMTHVQVNNKGLCSTLPGRSLKIKCKFLYIENIIYFIYKKICLTSLAPKASPQLGHFRWRVSSRISNKFTKTMHTFQNDGILSLVWQELHFISFL